MEEQDKKTYEISFLARGEEAAASIISYLSKIGAEILNEEKIEQISLAYPIKKQNMAHFGCVHFSTEPSMIAALEEDLRFAEGNLRYLIVTPAIAREESSERNEQQNRGTYVKSEPKAPSSSPTGAVSNEALEAKIEEISGS